VDPTGRCRVATIPLFNLSKYLLYPHNLAVVYLLLLTVSFRFVVVALVSIRLQVVVAAWFGISHRSSPVAVSNSVACAGPQSVILTRPRPHLDIESPTISRRIHCRTKSLKLLA
jgi:hypothetical protein